MKQEAKILVEGGTLNEQVTTIIVSRLGRWNNKDVYADVVAEEIIALIDQHRQAGVMEWIPISERLPDDKIEKFSGGMEGSWMAALELVYGHPDIPDSWCKAHGSFDSYDDKFYICNVQLSDTHKVLYFRQINDIPNK